VEHLWYTFVGLICLSLFPERWYRCRSRTGPCTLSGGTSTSCGGTESHRSRRTNMLMRAGFRSSRGAGMNNLTYDRVPPRKEYLARGKTSALQLTSLSWQVQLSFFYETGCLKEEVLRPELSCSVPWTRFHLITWPSTNFWVIWLLFKWVETNQCNFRIYPTDICLSPPHGTKLTVYADVRSDVGRCSIGWFPPTPFVPNNFFQQLLFDLSFL